MKFIREKDNNWHNPKEELPPVTTNIEFIDLSNTLCNGEIVVDMSGFYLYIRGKGCDSMDNVKQWRFV